MNEAQVLEKATYLTGGNEHMGVGMSDEEMPAVGTQSQRPRRL
jgi:hypothetical protein